MQRENNIAKIAKERIEILFNEAKKSLEENKISKAKRYITLALKIGMKAKVRIPKELRRKFCEKCHIYFIPEKTLRVRIKKGESRINYTCLLCGNVKRYPYIKEKVNHKRHNL